MSDMILQTRLWDVIVKYSGPESRLGWRWNSGGATARRLCSSNFAGKSEIDAYSATESRLNLWKNQNDCILKLFQGRGCELHHARCRTGKDGLTGKGILVGIVDSGVELFSSRISEMQDGSSRILRLWDQSIPGKTTARLYNRNGIYERRN